MNGCRQQVFDKVIEGIDTFISLYQNGNNPFDFIYEADIKCDLYASIKLSLTANGLRATNKWAVCNNCKTSSPSVQLVHSEQLFHSSRIDIAVWDPDDSSNCTAHYKDKKCFVLIEIKQNCLSEILLGRVLSDLKKISRWSLTNTQTGLALGFCTDLLPQSNNLIFIPKLQGNVKLGDIKGVLVGKKEIAIIPNP